MAAKIVVQDQGENPVTIKEEEVTRHLVVLVDSQGAVIQVVLVTAVTLPHVLLTDSVTLILEMDTITMMGMPGMEQEGEDILGREDMTETILVGEGEGAVLEAPPQSVPMVNTVLCVYNEHGIMVLYGESAAL